MPKSKGIETQPPPPQIHPKPAHTLTEAFALGEKITGQPPMAAAFRPNGDLVIIAHDGKKIIVEQKELSKWKNSSPS
jgi:hypothetical protein